MSTTRIAVAAIGLAGALVASQAQAQSASSSEQEIALLKQQLKMLEQKLDKLQSQTAASTAAAARAKAETKAEAKAEARAEAKAAVANANAAIPVKGPAPASGVVVTMPNNRPTICTADQANCVAITSRLHYDVGGYDYRPNTAATVPQKLDSGQNVRRARIGVTGKFFHDWNFALVYDFGGSSDGFGGSAPGSLPGGGLSGVENAYISYTGLKPFGGRMAVEVGIMDLPYTLDNATSSNDILFMERASPGVVATNIAAGDFRSAAGARWFNDQLWIGGYVTGPTTGAIHSASSVSPPGTSEQYGAVARVAGNPISTKDYTVHIGANAQWLIQPPRNLIANTQTVTLSDRPELRLDPTTLISTGAIANASGAQVYSIEAAATYRSVDRPGRVLLVQCRSHRQHQCAIGRSVEPEVPGRLRAGRLCADRRRPVLQCGYRGLWRRQAGASVLARRRRLGRVGDRRTLLDHRPQRPARNRERRRRRSPDRLYARAQLVRQRQRALHARLSARHGVATSLPDLDGGRRLEVRRGRNAHPVRVLRHSRPGAAGPLPDTHAARFGFFTSGAGAQDSRS